MRKAVFAVFALSSVASVARGQAPVRAGGEFRVNAFTTGAQSLPAASADASGRYVTVWQSAGQDGSGAAVVGRRLDPAGAPLGAEFVVNTYTTGDQITPSVAATPEGGFFVAWSSRGQDGSGLGVYGRVFGASGQPISPEFAVNTTVAGDQKRARVAAIPGGFVVVWEDYDTVAQRYRGVGRVYQRSGVAVSPEFDMGGGFLPQFPVAAGLPNGAYVLAWSDAGSSNRQHVHVHLYDTSGPLGPDTIADTQVLGSTHDFREFVEIVAQPNGDFTVGWDLVGCFVGDGVSCGPGGAQVRHYNADGTPRGAESNVNQASGIMYDSSLATSLRGVVLDAWTSTGGHLLCDPPIFCQDYPYQDGSGSGVYARRAGTVLGSNEFRVNTFTTGEQRAPSAASDPAGNALIVWQSDQDGDGPGIYGQRFGGLWPAGMDLDTAGNHVLEPGEAVDVRPSWRNVSGAQQGFTGGFSGLTGPFGPASGYYTLTDGSGSYGLVADNTTAPCTDCYGVAIADRPRPFTHWDATVLETLAPDTQGQQVRWPLHIGRSFGDVPPANPFYRYIETLLHRGITAGCTATTFCPGDATTRAAMSVFVLVAREGAGYTPPLCSPPNIFNDVPDTSPFCRFIEELANRGVAGGCGNGDFCPEASVTREQMAVFVLRTLDPTLEPPACAPPNLFSDVPETSPYCRWVEELANRGIVAGCGGGNYCGTAPVTREQMGVFLSGTFGLTLHGP